MTAWVAGFIGVLSTFGVGTRVLNLRPLDCLICILGSVFAGLCAVFLILRAEREPWIRAHILTRSLRTWFFFLSTYALVLLMVAPPVRDWARFLWLLAPLILCTGFTIRIFGPIQDRIVAKLQRKT